MFRTSNSDALWPGLVAVFYSCCCTAETDTTSWSNYVPIKKKTFIEVFSSIWLSSVVIDQLLSQEWQCCPQRYL